MFGFRFGLYDINNPAFKNINLKKTFFIYNYLPENSPLHS